MTYLRLLSSERLIDLLYEKDENYNLLTKNFSKYYENAKIMSRSEYDEYVKQNGISIDGFIKNLTCYNGLIDYGRKLLCSANGTRYEKKSGSTIFLDSLKYNDYFKNIYDIMPQIFDLNPDYEIDDEFLDSSNKWNDFSDDEWDDFIKKCIKYKIFVDTRVPIKTHLKV